MPFNLQTATPKKHLTNIKEGSKQIKSPGPFFSTLYVLLQISKADSSFQGDLSNCLNGMKNPCLFRRIRGSLVDITGTGKSTSGDVVLFCG